MLGTSHGALDLNSSLLVRTQKTEPYASMVETPTSQHHGWNSTSTIYLHGPSQLSNSQLHGRELNSLCPKAETKSSYMARSHLPTNVFFKIPKFSAHRFQAWRHSHSSPFPIWGLLWQLWLSYPLCISINCTQCLCTWTKSRIVQSPTKLNDKI